MRYLRPLEWQICRKLLTRLLADESTYLAIHDGEAFATPRTRNQMLLENFCGETDIFFIRVWHARKIDDKGVPHFFVSVGSIMMIVGNGEDIISDCTDNPFLNNIIKEVSDV